MLPPGGRGPRRVVCPRCRNPVESPHGPAIQPRHLMSKVLRDSLQSRPGSSADGVHGAQRPVSSSVRSVDRLASPAADACRHHGAGRVGMSRSPDPHPQARHTTVQDRPSTGAAAIHGPCDRTSPPTQSWPPPPGSGKSRPACGQSPARRSTPALAAIWSRRERIHAILRTAPFRPVDARLASAPMRGHATRMTLMPGPAPRR